MKNFPIIFLIFLITGTQHIFGAHYDLTLIGMVSVASACKLPSLWIDFLKDEFSINFIPTMAINTQDLSESTKQIILNPDKSAGTVSILLDNVIWTPDCDRTLFIPDSKIKIAYSMIESNKLIPQWVHRLNTTFDAVIVPDPYFIDVYKNSGVTTPIFVLPIGLDLDAFFAKPLHVRNTNAPLIFGMSGAFWERKNHIKVLEAFAQEFGNNPQVYLKLHGRGGYQSIVNSLVGIITQYQLNNVEISCAQFNNQEFNDFMSSLDAYILVSTAEGFSISPREAMALGIPCILSKNTAHITLCDTGFVRAVRSEIPREPDQFESLAGTVDRGNQFDCTVEDIRLAMRDLFENYSLYEQKAKNAREWVKQYRFTELKNKYRNLVKPKTIILDNYNQITADTLITNDINLYQKYISIMDF